MDFISKLIPAREQLFKQKIREYEDYHGGALHWAAVKSDETLIDYLLERGYRVDEPANNSYHAREWPNVLHAALDRHATRSPSVIRKILAAGADVHQEDTKHTTPLFKAVKYSHKDDKDDGEVTEAIVRELLESGADIHVEDPDGESVLLAAIESLPFDGRVTIAQVDVLRLLLDRGASVSAYSNNGYNALHAVARCFGSDTMRMEIMRVLISAGADVDAQDATYGTALQTSVLQGSETLVKFLLDQGANIRVRNGFFGGALQAAAREHNTRMMELVLNQGVDINDCGNSHVGTALEAAILGSIETFIAGMPRRWNKIHPEAQSTSLANTITFLCRKGADINMGGGEYGTVLLYAVSQGLEETVSLLLDLGADPSICAGRHHNVIQAAAVSGSELLLNMFLSRGLDINLEGGIYSSALQAAAAVGHIKIVDLLLNKGARVNIQGGRFGNALLAALSGKHKDIVHLLLANGADATIQPLTITKQSPLHYAVGMKDHAMLETLLAAGGQVHVDSQDDDGKTPLHRAVIAAFSAEDDALIKILLKHGASPDIEDWAKSTPIHNVMARNFEHNMKLYQLLFPKSKTGPIPYSIYASQRDAKRPSAIHVSRGPHSSLEVCKHRATEDIVGLFYSEWSFGTPPFISKMVNLDTSTTKHFFLVPTKTPRDAGPFEKFVFHWWVQNDPERDAAYGWKVHIFEPQVLPNKTSHTLQDFLHCGVSTNSLNVQRPKADETFQQLEMYNSWHTIQWIMCRSQGETRVTQGKKPLLQTQIFIVTQCATRIPDSSTDLFIPFVYEIVEVWEMNCLAVEEQLARLRKMVLKARGNDPEIISYLLEDTQTLETLKEDWHRISKYFLPTFLRIYKERWKTAHEDQDDILQQKLEKLQLVFDETNTRINDSLTKLANTAQSIIQLEFNLTSITEAQKSTSTNRSMKRLSWITFIVLPLLLISSLFGMNIDILANDPAWWWYLVLSIPVTVIVFSVWIVFKRSNTLEEKLENRFGWLVHKQNPRREEDLETGIALREDRLTPKDRTAKFASRGKKRS